MGQGENDGAKGQEGAGGADGRSDDAADAMLGAAHTLHVDGVLVATNDGRGDWIRASDGPGTDVRVEFMPGGALVMYEEKP